MDLKDPVDHWALSGIGPTRLEYDPDYVFTRITVVELRNGVFDRLVLLQELGLREDLAADRTGEDVVSEWEEEAAVSGGDIGFRRRRGILQRRVEVVGGGFGVDEGDDGVL